MRFFEMGVFGPGMMGGTHPSMGKVAASKYSAVPSSSRHFRPPGGASCSHASDPSAETTKLAVSTRQASRARLSVRGAAMENTPWCEFDLEPRQGRCSTGPAFGRAEAAHPRPEPVDTCSTPDGHTAGLPCARWIETRSAVCAKPARKHGEDVRGRAGACCQQCGRDVSSSHNGQIGAQTSPLDSPMRCREVPTKFPFTGVLRGTRPAR